MTEVNYLAVIVAALVGGMVVGSIWYAKGVFGKTWMRVAGVTEANLKKSSPAKSMVGGFIASLLMAYVLSRVLIAFGAASAMDGIRGGFWVWLGFVATVMGMGVIYERKSTTYWWVNAGYQLVALAVMGAILAVWV
jgi:hypothetical protein